MKWLIYCIAALTEWFMIKITKPVKMRIRMPFISTNDCITDKRMLMASLVVFEISYSKKRVKRVIAYLFTLYKFPRKLCILEEKTPLSVI